MATAKKTTTTTAATKTAKTTTVTQEEMKEVAKTITGLKKEINTLKAELVNVKSALKEQTTTTTTTTTGDAGLLERRLQAYAELVKDKKLIWHLQTSKIK